MTTDPWNIPYPSDDEIERQASLIVKAAYQEKRSFFEQVQEVKDRMGWLYLMPNRSEWIMTLLIVAAMGFMIYNLVSHSKELSHTIYNFAFFTSPFPILVLALYSLYEKREKQVMELEMTLKTTIFQIIALRMISFSGIALVVSITVSASLAINFELPFLHMWLISLAGLFTFTALLLAALSKGEVWKNSWGVSIAWVVINFSWMLALPESYNQVIFELPLVIYALILLLAFSVSCYTFTRTFSRKQEGLGLC